ncbi:MAG: hypothetical protein JWQ07_38 [Ramlibacter sp.]|nr:hypothetical protein [Ramlibacter sp.]
MAIDLVKVEHVLQQTRLGVLTLVDLHALNTVRDPYRAALLQPDGVIEANQNRVGHHDATAGRSLCSSFLGVASDTKADLAVAPEYCVPWSVIDDVVAGSRRPHLGGIWVLGCESITPADIETLDARYNQRDDLVFLRQPLDPRQVAQKRYLDPLLYVFWGSDPSGKNVLCLLVQFKTVACRDYRDVEQTSLCLGSVVYVFNSGEGKIRLMSIICSDAFEFTPLVERSHRDCLLIHIQLNPKPAHADYAAYRARLISVGSNSNVELICLNWARNVKEVQAHGALVEWRNVAGSAWYVPPSKFGADSASIDALHKKGLYYNVLNRKWHAFFLNYDGHVLLLQKQKVYFPGEQALVPRNCVEVEERYRWNAGTTAWDAGCAADDGFAVALQPYDAVSQELEQSSLQSPLGVERALEALMGPGGHPARWFDVSQLNALHLDPDEESIRRVTVHQEVDPNRPGVLFRKQRIQRAQDGVRLPGKGVPWPAPVRDLEGGFVLTWSETSPHHNVKPSNADRGTAMLVYLADEADDAAIERIQQRLRQGIRTFVAEQSKDKSLDAFWEDMVRSQDRLCIVFRRGEAYFARGPEGLNTYDKPAGESAVDFAGEAP